VVIPVHDLNPLRRTPWVTYALIAVNVVALLLTPAAPSTIAGGPAPAALCQQAAFYDRYAAIPRELVGGHPLRLVPTGQVAVGPRGPGCVVTRPSYQKNPVLSVLYSMFLHAGWLHLLGNMLFLLIFGNNIEDRLRPAGYLLFYLACGYVAAYGFAAANPSSVQPLIGASGAISGVLGAYLVLYPRARVWSLVPFLLFIPVRIPAWLVLGLWFVLQWAYSVGFVFGALAGLALRAVSNRPRATP